MTPDWISALHEAGYRAGMASIVHLADLGEGIDGPRRDGLLDATLDREYLGAFRFELPGDLPLARSLIVVAVPHPPSSFTFHWRGAPRRFVVPPTYLHSERTDEQVRALLGQLLAPAGFRVLLANVPKKLLAVCSGLARYGRNNVTYVPGMGSFHRLVALVSDLPCPEDGWAAPRMLQRCERCTACLSRCPTGAIVADRFVVHAERCLTFHNEQPLDVPFSTWIDPAWHNALVGCMRCQDACPENRHVKERVIEAGTFSEEETALLLRSSSSEQYPADLAEKLERTGLASLTYMLARNLGVLLD